MTTITPYEVEVGDCWSWMAFCDGMPKGCEKEVTCRLYVITAQREGRWTVTQDELNRTDGTGSFTFNGLVACGWFVKRCDSKYGPQWEPTQRFFAQLVNKGKLKLEKGESIGVENSAERKVGDEGCDCVSPNCTWYGSALCSHVM